MAAWLNQNGFDAVNVAGGMGEWEAAGKPMVSETGEPPFVRGSIAASAASEERGAASPLPLVLAGYSAKRLRRSFLENLPTLVFGTSSMNSTCVGQPPLGHQRLEVVEDSSSVAVSPGLSTTQASGRSSHCGCGDADDGGLLDRRVAHDRVLQVDRADPLAAGLDQVLGAVGDAGS